jgi:hypothetical protein
MKPGGFKLWVTTGFTTCARRSPHLGLPPHRVRLVDHLLRGVALQVAFERQTLKPVFSLDRL